MNMLHLAGPEDAVRLLPLIAAYHAHEGIDSSDEHRRAALEVLFSGEVQAAIWLIGPRRAPVGYIAVSFGFSIALGGRDAIIDEFYIRQAVRGRGMGGQALEVLAPMLRQMGVRALHLEVARDNARAQKLYTRAGFRARERYHLMTRVM